MKTQSTYQLAGSGRLRRVLQGNAIFSALSGVILIVGARPLAPFLGLDVPAVLAGIGAALLFYAASLFWIATHQPIDRRFVLVAAVLDAAWVIGSVILLLAGWLPLTSEGRWAVALVAEVVAIFAVLQFYSLRSWWAGRLLGVLILLALLLLGGGAAYQSWAVARDARVYRPPGQLVDVGGYRLHINCQGEGSPTVVIDNGVGDWSISWLHLQSEIAQITRVCLYDRAGLGWSDPGPQPRTSGQIVEELHTLLNTAGVAPPYVLVGHSFGGYNTRIYTDRYPDEVAGIVLVESGHEEQWTRLPAEVNQLVASQARLLRLAGLLARVGLLRVTGVPLPVVDTLSPELQPAYVATMLRSRTYDAFAAELQAIEESSAQLAATGPLDDVPLVVVSARHSFDAFRALAPDLPFEEADRVWMELQADLATLSTNSTHMISETGDHNINFTDPEMVLRAIRQVVAGAR